MIKEWHVLIQPQLTKVQQQTLHLALNLSEALCTARFPSQHSLKVHFPGIFLRKNSQNPVQYFCTWMFMSCCVNLQCKPGCACYHILLYTKPVNSVFLARSDWLTQARDILHTLNQWIVVFVCFVFCARTDWLTQARDILHYYTPNQWIVVFVCFVFARALIDLLKLGISYITIHQTSE